MLGITLHFLFKYSRSNSITNMLFHKKSTQFVISWCFFANTFRLSLHFDKLSYHAVTYELGLDGCLKPEAYPSSLEKALQQFFLMSRRNCHVLSKIKEWIVSFLPVFANRLTLMQVQSAKNDR